MPFQTIIKHVLPTSAEVPQNESLQKEHRSSGNTSSKRVRVMACGHFILNSALDEEEFRVWNNRTPKNYRFYLVCGLCYGQCSVIANSQFCQKNGGWRGLVCDKEDLDAGCFRS